jgi:hypothetical protein
MFLDEPYVLSETIWYSDVENRDNLPVLDPRNKISNVAPDVSKSSLTDKAIHLQGPCNDSRIHEGSM